MILRRQNFGERVTNKNEVEVIPVCGICDTSDGENNDPNQPNCATHAPGSSVSSFVQQCPSKQKWREARAPYQHRHENEAALAGASHRMCLECMSAAWLGVTESRHENKNGGKFGVEDF